MRKLLLFIFSLATLFASSASAQFFSNNEDSEVTRYLELTYQPSFSATSANTMSIQDLNSFTELFDDNDVNAFDFSDNILIAPTNVKRLGLEYSAGYFPGSFIDFEGLLYISASKEYFSLLGTDMDITGGTLYSAGLGIAARYKFNDRLSIVAAVKAGMESPTSAWFRHQSVFETGSHVKIVKNVLDDYFVSASIEHWNKPELVWEPSEGRMDFDARVSDRSQLGFNFGIGSHF